MIAFSPTTISRNLPLRTALRRCKNDLTFSSPRLQTCHVCLILIRQLLLMMLNESVTRDDPWHRVSAAPRRMRRCVSPHRAAGCVTTCARAPCATLRRPARPITRPFCSFPIGGELPAGIAVHPATRASGDWSEQQHHPRVVCVRHAHLEAALRSLPCRPSSSMQSEHAARG